MNTTAEPRLRIRYSAIVNYASFLYRLIVSVGFSTIVIRRLPIEEYGLFTTLFAIYGLFTPVTSLWMLWAYRTYARSGVNKIVTTGHTLGYIYSIVSAFLTIGFVLILPYIYVAYEYGIVVVLIIIGITGSFQVLYQMYSLFVLAYKPYIIGYANLVSETVRFIAALILVYYFKMGLLGALLAVLLTFITSDIIFLCVMLKKKIPWPGFGIDHNAVKLFFKNAYIPLINIIKNQVNSFSEKPLTGLFSSSPIYPAYLGIAGISRKFISGGGTPLIRSLSPSLLRNPNRNDIEDIIRITVIIMGFMAGSMIVYAKTIISLFNPVYIDAIPIFVAYSFVSVLEVFISLFSLIGTSIDRTDMETSGFALKRGLLFKNNMTILISTLIRFLIASVAFALLYFYMSIKDVLILLVFPVSSILVYIFVIYVLYKRSVELINYSIPLREILASIIGAIGIFVTAHITGLNNYIITRISKDYSVIMIISILSLATYLALVYLLSPWTRKFIYRGYLIIKKNNKRNIGING